MCRVDQFKPFPSTWNFNPCESLQMKLTKSGSLRTMKWWMILSDQVMLQPKKSPTRGGQTRSFVPPASGRPREPSIVQSSQDLAGMSFLLTRISIRWIDSTRFRTSPSSKTASECHHESLSNLLCSIPLCQAKVMLL